MYKKTRPWLRFIEGTEGAVGAATSAPSGSEESGEGNTNGGQAPTPTLDAPSAEGTAHETEESQNPAPAQEPTSEPAPEGEKADDGELTQDELTALVLEMKENLKQVNEERAQAAAEARAGMAKDIAKNLGLPESLAGRINGANREEMEKDAKELAQIFGARATDPTQGKGGEGSPQLRMRDVIAARIAATGLK